jgi:hypothetical protein
MELRRNTNLLQVDKKPAKTDAEKECSCLDLSDLTDVENDIEILLRIFAGLSLRYLGI